MDRAERLRRESGISSSKINRMSEEMYKSMCESEVTLAEARSILKKLGRILDEAEKRSPNTRLSEIPNPHQSQNLL